LSELEARLRLRLAHAEAAVGPPAPAGDIAEAAPARAERPGEGGALGATDLTPEEAEMLPGEPNGAGADREADEVLPPLDELAGRVPPAVVAAMDELFRAKWTAVRRFPREALKTEADS
jgi:hypothetical protein